MSVDPETLAFYEAEAETYTARTKRLALSKQLVSLVAPLPPGASVLDLGSGGGWASRGLRAQGFAVTALDVSAAMLAPLEAEGIATLHQSATDLAEVAAFDAIWSNCALQHMPRSDMPRALDRITAALKPGGRLGLCLHEGTETLRDRLGRLYCHWSEAEMRDLLKARGFAVLGVSHASDKGYDGRPITILQLEAQLTDA